MSPEKPSFALDIAFSVDSIPFDGRHRPMKFGFAQSTQPNIWEPLEGDRRLDQFELLQAGSGSDFYLWIRSNDTIDAKKPQAVLFSSRPAIETVATGKADLEGPFPGHGANIPFRQDQVSEPLLGLSSPALKHERFTYTWNLGPVAMIQLLPKEERSFELLVELRILKDGEPHDFKVDPELVIRGGG
jgi:hypothetical protein